LGKGFRTEGTSSLQIINMSGKGVKNIAMSRVLRKGRLKEKKESQRGCHIKRGGGATGGKLKTKLTLALQKEKKQEKKIGPRNQEIHKKANITCRGERGSMSVGSPPRSRKKENLGGGKGPRGGDRDFD